MSKLGTTARRSFLIGSAAIAGGVAVVATSTWAAFQAADSITFHWAPATYPANSAYQAAQVAAAFAPDFQDNQSRDDGAVGEALKTGTAFSAQYSVPYLAHATMEPMVAVALVRDDKVDVWAGNQLPTQVLVEAAKITGLPPDLIDVHTTLMGGGFGCRIMAVCRFFAKCVLPRICGGRTGPARGR